MEILKDLGTFFYVISPSETSFASVEEIPKPNYVAKAIPYFVTFIFLEYIVQIFTHKRRTRVNDGITSLALGIYLVANDLAAKGASHYIYIKVYEHWRVAELPWNSAITWWVAAVGYDFCFYWIHRASHEINFFWAHHQVHHSSEDYNLTTALRQPGFQVWFVWMFYMPLALFVPPQIFIVHQQFNLLFQFWIHTEIVDTVGPLEWIFNTPRHHRIHHGSNRYCLDKNYAGWLIIWDRMFGTFEEEKPGEEIKYGLVEEVKSFNPFWLQFAYVPKIWSRVQSYDNWSDKLSVVFKGPGWTPGKPRLGDINDVPLFPTRDRHDIKIPVWRQLYSLVHFLGLVAIIGFLTESVDSMRQIVLVTILIYVLASLTSIGLILENRPVGIYAEALRCAFVVLTLHCCSYFGFESNNYYKIFFALSAFIWTLQIPFTSIKSKAE